MPIMSSGFHVCINTADFERSIAFYKALGFTDKDQIGINRDTVKMQYLLHRESKSLIEIIYHSDSRHMPSKRLERKETIGLNHVGFHVRDIQGLRKQLRKLGVKIVEDSSRGTYDYIFCQTTIIFSRQRQLKIPIETTKKNHIFRPPFQLNFSEFSFS